MADAFTREVFDWLRQVALDQETPHLAARLAFVLKDFVNRQTREAYPTQERLAGLLGVTERAVRKCLEALVQRGHLTVRRGGPKRKSNTYRMVLQNRNNGSGLQSDQNRNHCSGYGDDEPVQPFRISEEETGTTAHENRNNSAVQTGTTVPPNYLNEPSEELSEDISVDPADSISRKSDAKKRSQDELVASFEEFWRVYPRKVAKGTALKAYVKAVRSGGASPAELLGGAMRYAAQRTNQDPTFTKHAATWLNGGCWADEPDLAPSRVASDEWAPAAGYSQRRTAFGARPRSALAAAFKLEEVA